MDHISIKNATRHNVGASQGYIGIDIRDEVAEGTPMMAITLRPTAEELARLNAGDPIVLRILGQHWPPVMLTVGDAPDYRALVFSALDSAKEGGHFAEGELLHGSTADEIAADLIAYDAELEGCEDPVVLAPFVKQWLEKTDGDPAN